MSDFDLVGQVIIVTGAAGGIGSSITREMRICGVQPWFWQDAQKESLGAVEAELGDSPTLVVPTDITNPESVQNLIDSTVDAFGRLDVMINNVGGGSTHARTGRHALRRMGATDRF